MKIICKNFLFSRVILPITELLLLYGSVCQMKAYNTDSEPG